MRNKLVKQESLLQRHIKTVETFEELMKQIKQWLLEIKEKVSVIKESPLPKEPEKIKETLQDIEVRMNFWHFLTKRTHCFFNGDEDLTPLYVTECLSQ